MNSRTRDKKEFEKVTINATQHAVIQQKLVSNFLMAANSTVTKVLQNTHYL
jgi:hypothetical protein